jgi:hypothetical protein
MADDLLRSAAKGKKANGQATANGAPSPLGGQLSAKKAAKLEKKAAKKAKKEAKRAAKALATQP